MADDITVEEAGTDADGNVLYTITMDDNLYERLAEMAAKRGISVDDLASELITQEARRCIAEAQEKAAAADQAPTATD